MALCGRHPYFTCPPSRDGHQIASSSHYTCGASESPGTSATVSLGYVPGGGFVSLQGICKLDVTTSARLPPSQAALDYSPSAPRPGPPSALTTFSFIASLIVVQ